MKSGATVDVGSLAWGSETGGRLSRGEQLSLLLRSLPELGVLARSRLLLAMGRRGPLWVDTAAPTPDTALADTLRQLAEEHYRDAVLTNHVYRTAVFADAIRQSLSIDVDRDLLWCACLLHDLGLDRPEPGRCFAVRSAQLARQMMIDAGATPDASANVADAVCRHPTPGLDPRRHPLPYLVATGALVDVAGSRLERFDPDSIDDLLRARPRGGFSTELARLWRAEAKAVPGGRAQLASLLGLPFAARHAPFD